MKQTTNFGSGTVLTGSTLVHSVVNRVSKVYRVHRVHRVI